VSEGEQQTGISNTVYNLTSVFYHAAQGGTVYAKYIEDAERQGDQELVDFFRQVQEEDARRAPEGQGTPRRTVTETRLFLTGPVCNSLGGPVSYSACPQRAGPLFNFTTGLYPRRAHHNGPERELGLDRGGDELAG
jgi:hypothetical protein